MHEAHLRTFTFDNIDVLLEQHPGVSLAAVQEKFVGRGRGGYCFEHSTLLAAALQRLGFDVRRQLGRVGDPLRSGRTHLVVIVRLDGEELLCDPGFGLSILRPHPLRDGAEDDHRGQRFRVDRVEGGWTLSRWHEGAWELQHTTDDLPGHPRRRRDRPPLHEHLPGVALPERAQDHQAAGGPARQRHARDA